MRKWMWCCVMVCIIACSLGLTIPPSACAGGGGGGGGGGFKSGGGGGGPVSGVTPADLVRAFGKKSQKQKLEKSIKSAEKEFDKNAKKANDLYDDLLDKLDKYKKLKKKMDDGSASFDDEMEFFDNYKDLVTTKHSWDKAQAVQVVATKNLDLAKAGLGGISDKSAKKLHDKLQKRADNNFKKIAKVMSEKTLEYAKKELKTGNTYENLEKTTRAVQLGSMLGSAIISGGLTGAVITTKAQLVAAVGNILASSAGGISDAYNKGKDVSSALTQGLVAGVVQGLGDQALGNIPGAKNAIANTVMEFSKSYTMDQVGSQLGNESSTSKTGNMGPMAPKTAPNFKYGPSPTHSYK